MYVQYMIFSLLLTCLWHLDRDQNFTKKCLLLFFFFLVHIGVNKTLVIVFFRGSYANVECMAIKKISLNSVFSNSFK